jgi:hypothetical protein
VRAFTCFAAVLALLVPRLTFADGPTPPPSPAAPAAPPTSNHPTLELAAPRGAPAPAGPTARRRSSMETAGIVLTAVLGGAGALLLIGGGAAKGLIMEERDPLTRSSRVLNGGDVLMISGAAVMAAGLMVGVPLWVAGKGRHERERTARLAFTPTTGPSGRGGAMVVAGTF